MHAYRFIPAIFITLIFLMMGCSSGTPLAPAAEAPLERATTISTSHFSMGVWQVTIDPVGETVDAVMLRTGNFHLNALPFLEPPALVNLSLDSLQFNGNVIEADIGLRHPFLGLHEFTGFDVCGVFIADGSVTGFGDSSLRMAGPGNTRLMNPDGWSRWWNPVEFPVNTGTIFGYNDGLLGTPDSVGNFNSTLNGYKYYCDDLGPSDPLSDITLEKRGLFSAGQKNVRHYTIEMNGGLVFNYAVDASWQFPSGDPPYTAPDDFGPDANRAEAYRIDIEETFNTLYNDGVTSGGELHMSVDIYDWQNAGLNTVTVESPSNFALVNVVTPTGGGDGYSTYEIDITSATPSAAGDMDILLSIASESADFEGFIPGVNTTAYFVHTTTVSTSGECPVPLPTAIEEDQHIANGSADTTITCTDLMGTTGIHAYLDMAGNIDGTYDITGTNVGNVDLGNETFDATFELTGATPGYYYVVVTNSCGETGASDEPLFLVTEYLEGDLYVSNHEDFDGLPETGTMQYPYHTINAAKNVAGDYDVILVDYGRGQYHESLYWNPYTGYLTVRAYNWYSPSGRPIIGGDDVVGSGETIGFFHAWDVTVQGFKIIFVGGTQGWQIMDIIHSHNILIKDCFFTGDSTYTDGNYAEAIGFHWSYDTTIQNCLFKDINAATSYSDTYVSVRGINSGWSRNLSIRNCEFTQFQTDSVPAGKSLYLEPVDIVFDYGNFKVYNCLIHHMSPDASSGDYLSFVGIDNTWPLDDGDPNTGLGFIYNNTIDGIDLSNGPNTSSTYAYGIKNQNYDTPGYDIDIHSNIVTNITGEASQYIWGIDDMNYTDYTDIWHVLRGSTEYPWYNPAHEGVGCKYVDPEYVNNISEPYNYHLQTGSPCIGIGEDGEDMGCYGNLAMGETVGLLGPED